MRVCVETLKNIFLVYGSGLQGRYVSFTLKMPELYSGFCKTSIKQSALTAVCQGGKYTSEYNNQITISKSDLNKIFQVSSVRYHFE